MLQNLFITGFFILFYTNTVKIPSKKIEVLFKLENFIKKNNPE